ncbi:unnamed protein product [Blepharisma stoltei]|uniref:Photosystem I assembly protein Ycf4 n=1 Tax=Blepharisma stoltei TaxID=1481888 RepID=A0AAU9KD56_9CILI|nr:unnamed protein product [Blepharisma stoltei]
MKIMRAMGTFIPNKSHKFPKDGKLLIFSTDLFKTMNFFTGVGVLGQIGSLAYFQLVNPSYFSIAIFGISLWGSIWSWREANYAVEDVKLLTDGKIIEIRTCSFRKKYKIIYLPIIDIKGSQDKGYYYLFHNKCRYWLDNSGTIFHKDLFDAILKGSEISTTLFIKEFRNY